MTDSELSSLWSDYFQFGQPSLRNAIAEAYLPLAAKLARKYTGRGVEYDDLYQAASLALVRAVEKYEPDRGGKFITYAIPTIEGALLNTIRDNSFSVHLPVARYDRQQAVFREIRDFEGKHFRSPSPAEIGQRLHVDPAEVLLLSSLQTVSLDASPSEDDNPLSEKLGFTDSGFSAAEDREWFCSVMEKLHGTDRELIRLRYIENRSQRDTAREMGISQMQVSRLEKRLLQKLRAAEAEWM